VAKLKYKTTQKSKKNNSLRIDKNKKKKRPSIQKKSKEQNSNIHNINFSVNQYNFKNVRENQEKTLEEI
jgi:hypothetical protein